MRHGLIGGNLARPPNPTLASQNIHTVHDLVDIQNGFGFIPSAERTKDSFWGWASGNGSLIGVNSTTAIVFASKATLLPSGTVRLARNQNATHSVVITDTGLAYGTGVNTSGQIGNSSTTSPASFTWVATSMPSGVTFVDAVVGDLCTFFLTAEGYLYGCGANARLGINSSSGNTTAPIQIGTAKWKKIVTSSAGATFGIDENDDLYAWGANSNYQTALGTNAGTTLVPTKVGTLKWRDVSVAWSSGIAITTSGDVYTWGVQNSSSVPHGDGTNSSVTRTTPTQTTIAATFTACATASNSAGSAVTVLALDTDGKIWSWGNTAAIVQGLTTATTAGYTPTNRMGNNETYKWIGVVSTSVALALDTSDRLWAWGVTNNVGTGGTNNPGSAATVTKPIIVATEVAGAWQAGSVNVLFKVK